MADRDQHESAEIPDRFAGYERSEGPDGSLIFERPGERWQYWPETGEYDLLTFISPGASQRWLEPAAPPQRAEAEAPAASASEVEGDEAEDDDDEPAEGCYFEVSEAWIDDEETRRELGLDEDDERLYGIDHERWVGREAFLDWLSSINASEDDIDWEPDGGGINISDARDGYVVARCPNGHPRTVKNTEVRRGGELGCRQCGRERRAG